MAWVYDGANLASGRLSEPESPSVLQRVLDIEVVLVVEDGDHPIVHAGRGGHIARLVPIGRNGDGGEVDLLRHLVLECVGGMGLKAG